MAEVRFLLRDGSWRTVEAPPGSSVRNAAVSSGIPGIIGECGGFCNCGTCHVYVLDPQAGEPSTDESNLLDGAPAERRPNSRLACQLIINESDAAYVIEIPSAQR